MIKSDEPVIIEEVFDAPITTVWEALTEHNQMQHWYFANIEAFRPEVGFETQFEVNNEGRKFTHLWEVIDVIPNQKITYTWKYLEYPGEASSTFELSEENGKVKLMLTMQVVESFPADIPEFKRESCMQGWNYFIGGNLKKYLEAIEKPFVK